ncbi:MAG: acetyl/propionyl-CoA carboxylase subunit alpha [Deltaproteobacteria bacterium HGW-Deltaproteobacteria-12]|jgi:propionyl-CoA carboxylase alpha chain|nr:MAG: acetyl/propionyl-CoA carboxylase subunit alpha [Deltaproteobacteria bacterium HGW-Deltaproteobacteria-12]
MINKILIANRGEIAVRILRTCKRLNIASVAVYSEADRHSLHAQLADSAVCIGAPSARESYLNQDKMIEAALNSGCSAIHPGYGFLSENAEFARRVISAGLIFIGPPPDVIALMGDKLSAKELSISAGVQVIPGHMETVANEELAFTIAETIGYPLLFKAAAGGGGKGMRIVWQAGEVETAFGACRQEARKAFGDGRIFIERFIEKPRHIEVQILADAQGNVIHLGERECSIQRRHQKIIEESPSPALSPESRSAMCQAACNLARKAGYINVGTVEFIYDTYGSFYFLEMNTRLQVEHPVTEVLTALDMVELQIRIASGESLPLKQQDVQIKGWAMEARICAEDQQRNFLPATGMITRYAEPRGPNIRVDSGIQIGSRIGIHYDSLLAKVISHGTTREEARLSLIEALNGYHIEGVLSTIDFAASVLCQPAFDRADFSTNFLEEHFEGARPKTPPDAEHLSLTAIASALIYHIRNIAVRESARPAGRYLGLARPEHASARYKVRAEDDYFDVRLWGALTDSFWKFQVNGRNYDVETPPFELYRRRLKLKINGQIHRFRIAVESPYLRVAFSGITRLFDVMTPREYFLMHYMPRRNTKIPQNTLACPMPGMVVNILVSRGDRVFLGQNLIILESMKMESGVPSPMDGVVSDICVTAGQAVEVGDVLIKFTT